MTSLLLAGCSHFESCVKPLEPKVVDTSNKAAPKPDPQPASELMIGIDGSGSLRGHAKAADRRTWEALLKAIKSTAVDQKLEVTTYRIGGPKPEPLKKNLATEAKDPCFFGKCNGYNDVGSYLGGLWVVSSKDKSIPLRLLVSDLEVNNKEISSLTGPIKKDLELGAAVGVLALKLPYEGPVYNTNGEIVPKGSKDRLNRPVYLLATGASQQVKELLSGISRNISLAGGKIQEEQMSLIDAKDTPKPLTATQHIEFKTKDNTEDEKSLVATSVRLEGKKYYQANNQDYVFVRVGPDSTSIVLFSRHPWPKESTEAKGFKLASIERIPLTQGGDRNPGSIQIKSYSITDHDLRMELSIPNHVQPGAIRATIPAGGLPEPWWITWNRSDPDDKDASEKTDGLLSLMLGLSQQVRAGQQAPPAAVFCLAFNFSNSK